MHLNAHREETQRRETDGANGMNAAAAALRVFKKKKHFHICVGTGEFTILLLTFPDLVLCG